MQWVLDNKEWIFSGIGVFALSLIVAFSVKGNNSTKQIQKSGNNSTNYQAAGDINMRSNDD